MVAAARKPLGQLLLDKGGLRPEQLQRALDEQHRNGNKKLLGEILIEQRLVAEEQLAEILANSYGIPFAKVAPRLCDPKVIPIIPRGFLEKHQVLPLFLVNDVLTVAVSEPTNVFLHEELERVSGKVVQLVAGTSKDIDATLKTYLPHDQIFVIDEMLEEVKPEDFTMVEKAKEDIANLEAAAKDSPVVKLVNYCVYNA